MKGHMSIKREESPSTSVSTDPVADAAAWEMIEAGRYMPRRIKGSYPGRELG